MTKTIAYVYKWTHSGISNMKRYHFDSCKLNILTVSMDNQKSEKKG